VLAIDDAGNGDAVWFEPNKGVIDRRFGATTGAWGTWNMIGYGVDNLRLAMSENGHAVVPCHQRHRRRDQRAGHRQGAAPGPGLGRWRAPARAAVTSPSSCSEGLS